MGLLLAMRTLRHPTSVAVIKSHPFLMVRVTYTVVVDPDVRFSLTDFAQEVAICLADPNGWESHGYHFVAVKSKPQVVIHLSSVKGLAAVGCDTSLSCAELGGKEMRINEQRWRHGSPKSGQDLDGYRQYVISHEMGHILGRGHAKCPGRGQPAPIMLQQTLGLHGCLPSTNV
jgi:hypothetical protein